MIISAPTIKPLQSPESAVYIMDSLLEVKVSESRFPRGIVTLDKLISEPLSLPERPRRGLFQTPYSPFWQAFGLAVQEVEVVGGGAISVVKVMATRPTWYRAAKEFTPLNVNSTTPEPISPL